MEPSTSPLKAPPRPPAADPVLVSRFSRLGPVGRCLGKALETLISEDEVINTDADADDSDDDLRARGPRKVEAGSFAEVWGRSRKRNDGTVSLTASSFEDDNFPTDAAKVDSTLKDHLMKAFGDTAAAAATGSSAPVEGAGEGERESSEGDCCRSGGASWPSALVSDLQRSWSGIPPAAVMRGRLEHYNRLGCQWRIAARDVVIRPRVNLRRAKGCRSRKGMMRGRRGRPKGSVFTSGVEEVSLWNRSLEEAGSDGGGDEGENAEEARENSIQLQGQVVILGYDDL